MWWCQRGHKWRHNMAHTICMLDKQGYTTRARTRLSVTLYVHCLCCLILFWWPGGGCGVWLFPVLVTQRWVVGLTLCRSGGCGLEKDASFFRESTEITFQLMCHNNNIKLLLWGAADIFHGEVFLRRCKFQWMGCCFQLTFRTVVRLFIMANMHHLNCPHFLGIVHAKILF